MSMAVSESESAPAPGPGPPARLGGHSTALSALGLGAWAPQQAHAQQTASGILSATLFLPPFGHLLPPRLRAIARSA